MPRVTLILPAMLALVPAMAAAQPTVIATEAAPAKAPAVTLSVGTILPVFMLYEFPGPWLAASVAWPIGPRTQVVASVDVGLLIMNGATRVPISVGGGVRVRPFRQVPVWGQLGVGLGAHVERINVILPERDVRATDVGLAVTVDASLGVSFLGRWEAAVAWDHRVLWTGPEMIHGGETLPYRGTVMLSVGRRL